MDAACTIFRHKRLSPFEHVAFLKDISVFKIQVVDSSLSGAHVFIVLVHPSLSPTLCGSEQVHSGVNHTRPKMATLNTVYWHV